MLVTSAVFVHDVAGQGMFERLNSQHSDLAAPILLYEQTGTNPMAIVGFASGSIYGVPVATNQSSKWISVVTARHALQNGSTGRPITGMLVKINMQSYGDARYLQVPLKHDPPRNYWVSPSGLDLCVIPVPPESVQGAQLVMFNEGQIVSPETHQKWQLDPGLIVEAISIQPEYLDPIDFSTPRNLPTVRIGHLSRVGFLKLPNGQWHIRPHVIDMHSGPGNSGASVVLHVPTNKEGTAPGTDVCQYMFLGIVMGFKEEIGSYIPYEALVTNRVKETQLNLVTADGGVSNNVAIAIKTVANPNLTYVVPVHELALLRDSEEYKTAVAIMGSNKQNYRMFANLPTTGKTPVQ